MTRAFSTGLALLAAGAGVLAGAAWVLPVEVFQAWNVGRAGADPYAQFEAAGQAEALTWLARGVFPLVAAALLVAWRYRDRCETILRRTAAGFLDATAFDRVPLTVLSRAFCLAWLALFVWHWGGSVLDRGRDWAYFRLNSGAEVLPNISFENRAVIRYLRDETPPDSRLLLLSDQSLFFVSYYLLPRRVFHKVHPEAEFVIPQAGQARPLAAYERQDLPPGEMDAVNPDYIVEYFEGRRYVDRDRIGEDRDWIAHWRRSTGERGWPTYLVTLSPAAAEGAP
jgi:hypothetical protein